MRLLLGMVTDWLGASQLLGLFALCRFARHRDDTTGHGIQRRDRKSVV